MQRCLSTVGSSISDFTASSRENCSIRFDHTQTEEVSRFYDREELVALVPGRLKSWPFHIKPYYFSKLVVTEFLAAPRIAMNVNPAVSGV
jgi:hypothetical protein